MLVGGLGGPVSLVKVGSGRQLSWVSTNPLMCALLILLRQKGCWGSLFLFLRSLIIAAVKSVVGGRLTKTASLLSATLRCAYT